MDPAHLNKSFSISNWLFLIPCYCQNSIGALWNTLVPTQDTMLLANTPFFQKSEYFSRERRLLKQYRQSAQYSWGTQGKGRRASSEAIGSWSCYEGKGWLDSSFDEPTTTTLEAHLSFCSIFFACFFVCFCFNFVFSLL